MRRDKNAPALYELIRDKPLARGVPRAPVPERAPPGSPGTSGGPGAWPGPALPAPSSDGGASVGGPDATGSFFSPGRSLRVPLGYLAPVGLLLAIVVVGAYVTGYNRRDHEERARAERESAAALDAVDPLVGQAGGVVKPKSMPADSVVRPRQPEREASRAQQSAGGTTDGAKDTPITRPAVPASLPSDQIKPQRPAGSPTGQPERAAPVPTPPPQANNPAGARPKGSTVVSGPGDDPRQVGLNYLIAATLTADEAERAAQFLAGRGLEVAVVPADNRGPSRWVVVLEGLTAKELGSTRARALEQKIQDLGRVYKQEFKGPTVFNDPWWKKHTKDSGSGGADSGGE